MKRATRKRDERLKTIGRPGISTTHWGAVKKLAPWFIIGAALWALGTAGVIGIIKYRLEGLICC